MTKNYYRGYEEGYKAKQRDTNRRDQSARNARYEAALFGAVQFEGREKQINEQETAQLDTRKEI